MVIQDICTTTLIVIPAKAGIQEAIDNTGFRVALRLHGMTKLLVLCIYAKVSNYRLD
jgi:hypothetical protein